MKKSVTLILASALVGTLTFTSLVPVAFAHDQNGRQARMEQGEGQGMRKGPGMRGGSEMRGGQGGPGGFVRLVCSADGAERLENAIDLIDNRVTLTDEQVGLLAELKTAALTAQTNYADSCVTPVRDGSGNFVDGLKHRQENMKAQTTAMEDVIPALDAFYTSLTDEQKADLMPRRGGQQGRDGGHQGQMRGQHRKG